ncbi:hypothetical protein PTTG_26270 [Puccinia triticina 1-1 BBBD Race 1]|uniref:Uncharacterized protein n=1 Tax=Puccinia triticina (isolate 1-1 / race 1 (BBBD)) TaxID=630390 RepID=A0A180GVN0_PUCT1|nr:hypothetical protein PTTG_26270 [Puccinia triticina 1-1 BBBD Race 1]
MLFYGPTGRPDRSELRTAPVTAPEVPRVCPVGAGPHLSLTKIGGRSHTELANQTTFFLRRKHILSGSSPGHTKIQGKQTQD